MSLIHDLYGHQEWADAEHWRALSAYGPALKDDAILKRLHHIHGVQHAFLFIVSSALTPGQVRGQDPRAWTPASAGDAAAVHALARKYHEVASAFVTSLADDQLARPVTIPWFPGGAFTLTAGEALTQAAMHSHYHRGQNATRLRELGGEPPTTDLILWIYKGRPAADWRPS